MASGQERVVWNPLALAIREGLEFFDPETARLKKTGPLGASAAPYVHARKGLKYPFRAIAGRSQDNGQIQ
jgi:hypothetical protein